MAWSQPIGSMPVVGRIVECGSQCSSEERFRE